MDVVKLGRSGQVALPRALLRRLGVGPDAHFAAETTSDGAIVLRPLGIYPIEVYSDERIAEFMDADVPTEAERRSVQGRLDAHIS